jgi:hypothetical protein
MVDFFCFFYFIIFYSFIHLCIHCLCHFKLKIAVKITRAFIQHQFEGRKFRNFSDASNINVCFQLYRNYHISMKSTTSTLVLNLPYLKYIYLNMSQEVISTLMVKMHILLEKSVLKKSSNYFVFFQ